jgi:hypothetical protein
MLRFRAAADDLVVFVALATAAWFCQYLVAGSTWSSAYGFPATAS